MHALRYRFATSDDAALLARLNVQLVEAGADFGPAEPAYLERRMRRWLGSGHDHAVLFEGPGGEVLAYAVYEEQASEIYLRQFLVLGTARRHGIGREVFRLLRSEIWCKSKRLTLEVLSSNGVGYRFWRSLGYRNCAVTLEIPAQAAEPSHGIERSGVPVARALPATAPLRGLAWLPMVKRFATAPQRLLRSLYLRTAHVAQVLGRYGSALAFAGFVSVPGAVAAPVAAVPVEVSLTSAAALSAPALRLPRAVGSDAPGATLSDAELRALRSSGAHCATSIYRTAWSMARTYQMEPAWVAAIIEAESSCQPNAVSKAGALGLMQLMPGSGARDAYRLAYGRNESPSSALLRDPQANIRLGVAYLRGLHRHFVNIGSAQARLLLAVASYNCGTDLFDAQLPAVSVGWDAAEVERWIALHAPRETSGYVAQVRTMALRYTAAIQATQPQPLIVADALTP